VAAEADVFIEGNSLAPVLPISASPSDWQALARAGYESLLAKGVHYIREGVVHFADAALHDWILNVYARTF
jgi:hypothetical protein